MWLKSERGEIEVYLCPEDDCQMGSSTTGCTSPRSVSSLDEGKGESSSLFDSKSALDAASRTPEQSNRRSRSASRCEVTLRPEETGGMKYAFISEDDDFGTMGSNRSFPQVSDGDAAEGAVQRNVAAVNQSPARPNASSAIRQTPVSPVVAGASGTIRLLGRNVSPLVSANSSPTSGVLPFLSLEPPLSEEDYNFALEASEGIADLFDEDLLLNSG